MSSSNHHHQQRKNGGRPSSNNNDDDAENTTVGGVANLAISKLDDVDPAPPGTQLTYTISVVNNFSADRVAGGVGDTSIANRPML